MRFNSFANSHRSELNSRSGESCFQSAERRDAKSYFFPAISSAVTIAKLREGREKTKGVGMKRASYFVLPRSHTAKAGRKTKRGTEWKLFLLGEAL